MCTKRATAPVATATVPAATSIHTKLPGQEEGQERGEAMGAEHHTGDLPSIRANAQGVAHIDVKIGGVRVGSGMDDIVGRGLIVHRDPDDFTTQPTGNAGPRLACAVIQHD